MNNIKEFIKDLSYVDTISLRELENKLNNIFSNIDEETSLEIVKKCKSIANESSQINEGEGLKKTAKELVGELFPSLSFYPALGIWGMVDKMIQTGEGFDALTPEQQRLFPVYVTLFFGLVGSKLAYNRLMDMIKSKKTDKQINEVLRLAGIDI